MYVESEGLISSSVVLVHRDDLGMLNVDADFTIMERVHLRKTFVQLCERR